MHALTLLLLAGTGEARQIAENLTNTGADFTPWLPGEGRLARGWSRDAASGPLAEWLANPSITAVLDASHPFSTEITRHASHHCARHDLPYCLLRRPEWQAQPGDFWTRVANDAGAARHIPAGAIVFVATGREGLIHFAACDAAYIYCRQIDAPDTPFPFPNGEYLIQKPPFAVEEEMDLFQRLDIEWLVLRNSGSTRAATKFTAARRLGLKVVMIDRPDPPDAPHVTTVAQALEWARRQEHRK